jgi:hypothetical protein
MTRCPKCHSMNISGPVYEGGYGFFAFGEERLVYTCRVCGYRQATPCKDAEEKKNDA